MGEGIDGAGVSDELYQMVHDLLVEDFEKEPENISLDSNLYKDLGFDSIDALDLVALLEDRLHISFEESELKTLRTIRQVIELIQSKTKP